MQADPITFTGAVDNDLSKAGNWPDSTLPTEVDDVIVPVAAGGTIVNSAAFAVKSLKVRSAGAFTLSGTGTITLGSGGMTFDTANTDKAVTIAVPLATTCDQVWDLQFAIPTFSSTITAKGTETLDILNMRDVTITVAPDYAGLIRYYSKSGTKNMYYSGDGAKRWADRVLVKQHKLLMRCPEGYDFATVFPHGLEESRWTTFGLLDNVSGKTLTMGAGAKLLTGGDNISWGQNTLVIDGGLIKTTGIEYIPCGSTLLFKSGVIDGSKTFNSWFEPNTKIEGDAWGFFIGYGSNPTNDALFVQTGGAMTNRAWFGIGGRGGNGSAYSEYRLEGGTHQILSDNSLMMCASFTAGNKDQDPGVFRQTGGTLTTSRLYFGSGNMIWGEAPNYMTNGFAVVDLAGGDFLLGANRITFGKAWNHTSKYTSEQCPWANGTYDIRLHGGTFRDSANKPWTNSVQMSFPPTTVPGTINWGTKYYCQQGPIWGEGWLRKAGSGKAVLVDASRFTGKLEVAEGSVELPGTVSDVYTEGATIFTADTAAVGKADGDEVASWSDESGTMAATDLKAQVPAATNVTLHPKVVANSFNGHAGLKFWKEKGKVSALAIPHAQNPLTGATNFTVAVVLKTTSGGHMGNDNDYQNAYQQSLLGCHFNYGYNGFGIALAEDGYLTAGRSYQYWPESSADQFARATSAAKGNDDAAHVFICTFFTSNVVANLDGQVTTRVRATIPPKDSQYKLFCKTGGASLEFPLAFGLASSMVWNYEGYSSAPQMAFSGELAEVRFYKNRVLTVPEMNGLMAVLRKKYTGEDDQAAVRKVTDAVECAMGGAAVGPDLPSGALAFDADDLTDADGAEVTTWTSTDGMKSATKTVAGASAGPVLAKGALSGKSVLRFSAASGTALALAAADSPVAGAKDVTVAVVFRATTAGVDKNTTRGGSGLVSSVSASGTGDVALSFHDHGEVAALYGGSNGVFFFNRKPCRLDDGQAHIAILADDQTNKILRRMVDGRLEAKACTCTTARGADPLFFGAHGTGKHFTGDIAAVAIWDRALTEAEMRQAQEHFAYVYKTRTQAKGAFAAADVTDRGLRATNIAVAAGAAFRVPFSKAAPFTVGKGMTLTGAGAFQGSYRWGADATVDPATDIPANIDDVQFVGCTVRFAEKPSAALDLPALSFVSGTVTFDFSAFADEADRLPRRVPLIACDASAVADDATLVVAGLPSGYSVVYDEKRGALCLYRNLGLSILVR